MTRVNMFFYSLRYVTFGPTLGILFNEQYVQLDQSEKNVDIKNSLWNNLQPSYSQESTVNISTSLGYS